MLKHYLKQLFEIYNQGDAREESYYTALEDLFIKYTDSTDNKNIRITILPKKTEAGNPDFRIWDGTQKIVGYIEAKTPTVENLEQIEETEQLKRYLHTFPNLILTNFYEFRLYRYGTLIHHALIGRPLIAHKIKTIPPVEKEADYIKLLEKFFSFSLPSINDARTLAIELAKRTRFLRDEIIAQELMEEERKEKGFLFGFYETFKKYLISGLSKEDFADLYAQTITYGLFVARTRTENSFNRKLAYDKIPSTIGILKDVFKFISLGDLPVQMEWIIDDIAEVLAVTDVNKILHQYFQEHKGEDPIIHFYETFLSEYDPQTREKRGVYYTPEPIVSYIIRSLNYLLKKYFNKTDGFASRGVTVLDPAGGTLTFLANVAKLAVDEFISHYGEGGKMNFIKDHILNNFYAFELMMAPYAVGHIKMSYLLEELGYKLQKEDRFKLYLTNTLQMETLTQTEMPWLSSLSEESFLAGKVKKDEPILVILGNPPYSGLSANINPWIDKLLKEDMEGLQSYYKVDEGPLKEKNPKWLQDDYVKFIRFAQWKINQAGEGVLGFITNHSYLDNPTFRGMRQSLMKSFNEIYILDLHGNSLKREKCPDGSKDENVFDIRQGVSIALFIKKKDGSECKVYHSELWGLREYKYRWLLQNDIESTNWQRLYPKSEFYLFIPREEELLDKYNQNVGIVQIFPVNSVGIVTSRDNFVIDFNKEKLIQRIRLFCDEKMSDEIIREIYNLKDKSNWKLKAERENIKNIEDWEELITKVLYRPFDIRWVFYHDVVIERSRKEVMRHMMQENLGLITSRQMGESSALPIFATNLILDAHSITSSVSISNLFPLYLYPTLSKEILFNQSSEPQNKVPNINPLLFTTLAEAYNQEPSPEYIFYYTYAVLYSNIYRTKYAEFLKIDFPRIPFTRDYQLFTQMASLGQRLVDLHLLKSPELNQPIAKFQGEGINEVKKVKYTENRLYINDNQFFEGVNQEVWQYHIGGYQVCDKWLKDRKGRRLSLEDIKQYCKIVTSLQKTMVIQQEIDSIYSEVEEDTIPIT